MPYSNNILNQALDRLRERRAGALKAAEYKRSQLHAQCPRLEEIDRELRLIGSSAALSAIKNGNTAQSLKSLAERSLELQEEYAALLSELGFTPESLEPVFCCTKCSDTGYIEADNKTVICDCVSKLMSDIACESLNSGSPLELSTFESFSLEYYADMPEQGGVSPLSRMSNIYNYCRRYADTFSLSSRSLLMRGATGLGKTHLSLAIANEVMRKGMSVVYASAPDILSRLEREHFTYKYDAEQDTYNSLLKCDLLILDDLGTEFMSQFSVAAVYNIFNSRILSGKPTILNTNLTVGELLTAYSQRFVSRIMGSCDRLDFIGEDIRAKF